MGLDARLLEILACPSCHSPVKVVGDEIHCTGCSLAYPIRDDIPVMLIDEAHSQ